MDRISRRLFLAGTATAVIGMGSGLAAERQDVNPPKYPNEITIDTEEGLHVLRQVAEGRWEHERVVVVALADDGILQIRMSAPEIGVKSLRLSWAIDMSRYRLMLGDHWERAYGDLHWAAPNPARVMPWYFLAYDGECTDGYGVMCGASALCHWEASPERLTLVADVRCGGRGVELGSRTLDVCSVVNQRGEPGESPFQTARVFCKRMSPSPRLASHPVYGSNDWYHTYGEGNSSATILRDTDFITSIAPSGPNRPYVVVDCGWQLKGGCEGGPWDRSSAPYPDMPGLASEITKKGARPGIWIRLLAASEDLPAGWRLGRDAKYLDPTVPEALAQVRTDVKRLRTWGYQLIKHDFSTFDITGRWGQDMAGSVTGDGWAFSNRGVTTAEAVVAFYRTVREAAGDALVLGCNTIGHLSAGLFEISRTGDDVSGKEWERTRKMGINALAFRAPQHNAFYAADADCFAMVSQDSVPWAKNRQWLDLLARSGTPLFISVTPDKISAEQEKVLREAVALAVSSRPVAEPLDWLETPLPRRWKLDGELAEYDWA